MSWVLTFIGISALVILHEGGHFAAAKAVGMRVERFSLFFGPAVFKVKRGETEYRIGTVPLGGYVKISGMNPLETMPEGEEHRGYFRQPVWKRIVVIAAGPAVNILIAFFVLFGVYAFSAQRVVNDRAKIASVRQRLTGRRRVEEGRCHHGRRWAQGRSSRTKRSASSSRSPPIAAPGHRPTAACRHARALHRAARRASALTLSVKPRYEAKEKRSPGRASRPAMS